MCQIAGGRKSAPPGSISVQTSKPHTASMGKTPRELNDDIHSQLNAVEKLQYQLTSHELQYAQRMAQSEQQAVDKAKVTVVSSSSDSNEGLCVLTYCRTYTVTTFIVRFVACVAGVWKGKEKGFGREGDARGALPRVSLAPKTPFPVPFKRVPRRLCALLL